MTLSILFIQTYYPEFLKTAYARTPALATMPFEQQRSEVLSLEFGQSDAYSRGLRALGCTSEDVICNADAMQQQWAKEHGLEPSGNVHDQRRQIVAAQIDYARPDVVFAFEWHPLGDAFLADVKPKTKLVVGQVASPLHDNRTYGAYDLMISSFPPLADYFNKVGIKAEYMRLGVDGRVIGRLQALPYKYDVTFVGGFAPSHIERINWLEKLLQTRPVDVFGYGVDSTPPASPIRSHHRGEVWGRDMYKVLQQSRITLNRHARISIRGKTDTSYANNLRLYEATGAGTCLFTEDHSNLEDMFDADREVVTYRGFEDCVEKLEYYLSHDDARETIAGAGRLRTLREHTFERRMEELLSILRMYL